MELNNLFKLVTKSGHPSTDVVKSAIQKYARRGMPVEMLQAVSEMDAFSSLSDSENIIVQRSVKAIRTNMVNRLKIILFEDVSFSQIGSFISVIERIKEWEDGDRVNKNILADIVSIIANSKKLRLPSFIRASFGHGTECNLAKKDFIDGIENKRIECIEWLYHNEKEALDMLSSSEFNFIGKEIVMPLIINEWKRLKPTKSKKGSNERFIFLVVPWLWIMFGEDLREDLSDLREDLSEDLTSSFNVKDVEEIYSNVNVKFDDYVYDKHTKVGKKEGKTLKDFKSVGAIVHNEDILWLDKFAHLKENYNTSDKPKPKPKVKSNAKPKVKSNAKPKVTIEINEIKIDVNDIQLITENVCSGKLPCGYVTINDEDKVIKPMTKGLNHGLDYLFMDKLKSLFGLNDLGIELCKIHGKTLKMKRDTLGRTYTWEDNEEGQVIAIMKKINVKNDLGKLKKLLQDESKFKEMLKIRLFNGLFRSSDNILRNILVDDNDELWAIDENDIFGKRKTVFNKKEPVKRSEFLTVETIEKIIEDFDLKTHEQTIQNEIEKYFPEKCQMFNDELKERMCNYKQIVLKELGFQ